MLDEHPWDDAASLLAVQSMKPFWSAGMGCYKRINDEFLCMYEKWEDDDGELAVGVHEDDTIGKT
jgi:hypothetical protein